MSRIKSLVIENYRSIEHIQFSFEDLIAFVGPNNSGKTNILRAINWFLTPRAKLDQEDFLNREKVISVTAVITDLTQEQINLLAQSLHVKVEDFLTSANIVVRRTYKFGSNASILQLDVSGNDTGNVDFVSIEGENDFFGEIPRILPSVLYFPAFGSGILQTGNDGTSLTELLKIVLELVGVVIDSNFADKNDVVAVVRNQEKAHLVEEQINKILSSFFHVELIKLKLVLPTSGQKRIRVCFTENGEVRRVSACGQGLIRLVQISVLSYLSNIKFIGNNSTGVILLIDEPELSLHPQMIDALSHSFVKLIGNDKCAFQIAMVTHSPVMVRNEKIFDNICILSKCNNYTKIRHRNCLLIKRDANESQIDVATNLENLSYALFSQVAVVVEGATERIVLGKIIEHILGIQDKICVVVANGCENVLGVVNLLRDKGIKSVAIVDLEFLQKSLFNVYHGYGAFVDSVNKFKESNNMDNKKLNAIEMSNFALTCDDKVLQPFFEEINKDGIWAWHVGDIEHAFFGSEGKNKVKNMRSFTESISSENFLEEIEKTGGSGQEVKAFCKWLSSSVEIDSNLDLVYSVC